MSAPKWALDLVAQVACDEGRTDIPEIAWRRGKGYGTTGRTMWLKAGQRPLTRFLDRLRERVWRCRIVVTAGAAYRYRASKSGRSVKTNATARDDQRLTLLHELAHWLCGPGEHHPPLFWDTAWRLYRRYKVPINYAKAREGSYRKESIAAYSRSRGL